MNELLHGEGGWMGGWVSGWEECFTYLLSLADVEVHLLLGQRPGLCLKEGGWVGGWVVELSWIEEKKAV